MANIFKSPYKNVEIPIIPLFELVLSKAESFGDRVALVDGASGREVTFKQVVGMTKKCAAGLHARGFKKGDVFMIFCPNLPEYPVPFHAVGMIGGIVTTANVLYTPDELAHQIRDSGAIYILTISMFYEKAKEAAAKVGNQVKEIFTFDKCEGATPFSELLTKGDTIPKVEINPKEDTVVLPYSSGTTGFPKGVVLTHYNLVSNILQVGAMEPTFLENAANEALIGVLPFFHIYALLVVLNYGLFYGLKTVVMSKFDLEQFLGIIQNHKITYAHLVPPILIALAKHPIVDKYDLSSLKCILSGAAPLGGEPEKAVNQRLKHVVIKQAYGMTEMSPASHYTPTSKIIPGSIGPLVPNCESKIVDIQTGELLPVGKDGEICVRGPNIMKGYLNNEEATTRTLESDGWLHTGDIGHVDEDGYFFIVDRLKELIKYKGYQVPPAELEAILLTHPAVADAAVIPKPDEEAGEVPKAFVVLKAGQQISADEIAQFVNDKVAVHYKLRGGVEFIQSIPKSASGKILRRVLVEQERQKAHQKQ